MSMLDKINNKTDLKSQNIDSKNSIAIVGMSCRFPDALNYNEFWDNLKEGKNSIKEITKDRWDISKYYSPDYNAANKSISKWCGMIDDIDKFDNRFFNISPREAKEMDPQQRILLEETWHCIEDSGIPLSKLQNKKTSVYVGIMASDYQLKSVKSDNDVDSYACLGSYENVIANRISYIFNFTGLSVPVNSACASSIVGLHEAKNSILAGESDYAIVAGVNLNLYPWKYISFSKARMLSPDGQCKTFDKDANGYVPGDGIGVILIKKLNEAIMDNDNIHGVIMGSSVNHVGKSVSITAPSVESQKEVILSAYKNANIQPETINYIEAHGTGTSLGDPIEVEALTKAFGLYTNKNQFCNIGSVKTNIGHLEGAAGIASIIKVLIMMKNMQIPKTININELNPIINFKDSPFKISDKLEEWKQVSKDIPLRAGVSSFGFGGVNSHVVLQKFTKDKITSKDNDNSYKIFTLSAKSSNSLKELLKEWWKFVKSDDFKNYSFNDICSTLMYGRKPFKYRLGKVVQNKDDIVKLIEDNEYEIYKVTEKDIYLKIGNKKFTSFKDIKNLYDGAKQFKNKINCVLKMIRNQEVNVDDFYKTKWTNKEQDIYSFIILYSFSEMLMENNLVPKMVSGEGNGLLVSMVICKMIDFNEAIKYLNDKSSIKNVRRPNLTYFDVKNNRLIKPFIFNESYIKNFTKTFEGIKSTISHYVNKARILYKNQFTFKKLVDEWQGCLQSMTNYNIIEMIYDDKYLKDLNEEFLNEKLFILLVIVSSLAKLNEKWNLTNLKISNEDKIYEIVDLILDGVMSKENLISLLLLDDLDYEKIRFDLYHRQNLMDTKKPYSILRKLNTITVQADNLESYIEKLTYLKDETVDMKKFAVVNIGDNISDKENDKMVNIEFKIESLMSLYNSILGLWANGVDVNFENFIDEHSFNKVNLPVYKFEKNSHWISNKVVDVIKNTDYYNDISRIFIYKPLWKESEKSKNISTKINKCSIIFLNDDNLGNEIFKLCREKYGNTNVVAKGSKFHVDDSNKYYVNYLNEDSYIELINNIMSKNDNYEQFDIYYIFSYMENNIYIKNCKDMKKVIESISKGLFLLLKSLISCKYKKNINLIIPTLNSFVLNNDDNGLGYFNGVLIGLLRTVMLECPRIKVKLVDFSNDGLEEYEKARKLLIEVDSNETEILVAYRNTRKYIFTIEKENTMKNREHKELSIRENGNYVIIGGAGAIGLKVSNMLAKKKNCRIILIGRSPISNAKKNEISKIESLGSEVVYIRADVSDFDKIASAVNDIKSRFGDIHGIIHSGGVVNANAIINKSWDDFENTISSKVYGIWNLNELTKNELLDFFIAFSSSTSIITNPGLSDYSSANSFLDTFIAYRNKNNYHGKSVVVNWTLWEDGGMGKEAHIKNIFEGKTGTINSSDAINALEAIINSDNIQHIVVGNDKAIENEVSNVIVQDELNNDKNNDIKLERIKQRLCKKLMDLLSSILEIEVEELDVNTDIREYGIDSISLTEYSDKINKYFVISINPTIFYEYATLGMFSEYILKNYNKEIITKLGNNEAGDEHREVINIHKEEKSNLTVENKDSDSDSIEEPIAIIGISGVMPESENLDKFWDNLIKNVDCVSEIPKNRWDWKEYFGDPVNEKNKTNSKWGGFIKDVDCFDSYFFGISPKEAELMDPQQRIFLETVWKTIEDSGYSPLDLKSTNTGVFVGAGMWDYYDRLKESGIDVEAQITSGISHSIISNRISYLFDFHGPSETIDTACSSSLVAIHNAIQAIRSGECQTAIAGAVNVIAAPTIYISLSKCGMLSPDGRCKTFDKDANGYVRGEGAGAILLKPLAKAIHDHDHIYGIIKGISVNHGGKSNSLTSPNPVSQSDVIINAIKMAKVDPSTISYIEAHGTGTSLGDPIEINGIKKAFDRMRSNVNFENKKCCGIGAVKSNIGHLETAAGMASLFKVLLSLKNNMIPGNLHMQNVNPYINLDSTPFYFITQNTPWECSKDSEGNIIPRRAGISSFGFGGVNSHMIIEEFVDCEKKQLEEEKPEIIIISAKSKNSLNGYVRNLNNYLNEKLHNVQYSKKKKEHSRKVQDKIISTICEKIGIDSENFNENDSLFEIGFNITLFSSFISELNEILNTNVVIVHFDEKLTVGDIIKEFSSMYIEERYKINYNYLKDKDLTLKNIAYTLQVGRSNINKEKLAIIALNTEDLIKKLNCFSNNKSSNDIFYREYNKKLKGVFTEFDEDMDYIIRKWSQKGQLQKIAEQWINGVEINWKGLWGDKNVKKISLPTYNFEKKSYWVNPKKKNDNISNNYDDKFNENTNIENDLQKEKNKILVLDNADNYVKECALDSDDLSIKKYIIELFSDILKIPQNELSGDTIISEIGIDSILAIQIIKRIEKKYSICMQTSDLTNLVNINFIVDYISKNIK